MKGSRLLLPLLLLLVLPWQSRALGIAHDHIYVSLNKADGLYEVGDTARVYARCDADLGPLRLKVMDGHHQIVDSLLVFGNDTTTRVIYSEVCDKPKGILVILGPDGNDKYVTSAGYVVAHDAITPGFDAPEDLYAWWEKQIKKMRKARPVVTVEPVAPPEEYADSVICWHVTVSMPEGRPVQAYVARPVVSRRKSLPIYLTTHGATAIESPRTRSSLNTACKYASRGAIAADINAHGMLDDAPASYYEGLANGELKGYSKRPLTDRDSFYFRLMFLRLERMLDYLCGQKEWDHRRVMIRGGSQGGAQALFLAGMDRRVTHCLAMVPAMTDFGGTLKGRAAAWPESCSQDGVAETAAGRDILPYFDGALLISRFKGKLFLEAGFIDTTCPPTCIYAVYNNAVSASERIIMPYVYRRHCCVDSRYNEHWTATVKARRDGFSYGFLNGK